MNVGISGIKICESGDLILRHGAIDVLTGDPNSDDTSANEGDVHRFGEHFSGSGHVDSHVVDSGLDGVSIRSGREGQVLGVSLSVQIDINVDVLSSGNGLSNLVVDDDGSCIGSSGVSQVVGNNSDSQSVNSGLESLEGDGVIGLAGEGDGEGIGEGDTRCDPVDSPWDDEDLSVVGELAIGQCGEDGAIGDGSIDSLRDDLGLSSGSSE